MIGMEKPWTVGESCAWNLGARAGQGLSKCHVAVGEDEKPANEIWCRVCKAAPLPGRRRAAVSSETKQGRGRDKEETE